MSLINLKITQTISAIIFIFSVLFNITWLSYIMGVLLIITIWIPTNKKAP